MYIAVEVDIYSHYFIILSSVILINDTLCTISNYNYYYLLE